MTKYPILHLTTRETKKPYIPPPPPPAKYEEAAGWARIEEGYKQALRGKRKYTREAVNYDLLSEVNNVELWRELKAIGPRPEKGKKEYHPGPYRHKTITEPPHPHASGQDRTSRRP